MAAGTLIGLILVAVVAIILFNPLLKFSKDVTNSFERETCKNSVFQQSLAKELPSIVSGELHTGPDCQTYDITFYNDHVEQSVYRNGKIQSQNYEINIPTLKDDKFKTLNSEIVHYVVAEELSWCWYQFLKGERHIFMDNKWYNNDLGDNNLAGFICSNIRFNYEDFYQKKIFTGFYDYMQFAQRPESKEAYFNYLINHSRVCKAYDNLMKNNLQNTDQQNQKLAEYLNHKYSYSLDPEKTYAELSELPNDACWNFFVDGIPVFDSPAIEELVLKNAHPEIQRAVTFETDKTYAVIMLRMGADKEEETYFAYVVPVTALQAIDEKYGLEYIG